MRPSRITQFEPRHLGGVVALWRAVFGYETAHNDPALIVEKKAEVKDGLFFMAEADSALIHFIFSMR